MRRTLDRLRDAWATWKLWRHNRKFFIQVALETAGYFTGVGERAENRQLAFEVAQEDMLPGATLDLLNPAHTLTGADPFGRFARALHGDSDV